MAFVLTADGHEFRCHAWPLLQARDCNVLATVLLGVLDGHYDEVERHFAYRLDGAGRAVTAALRTAPQALLCSALEAGEAEPLMGAWLDADPDLPGVSGVPATARALAAAWADRTGGATRLMRAMAMHAVSRPVDPRRVPPGTLRAARDDERALLVCWWLAFARDAGAGSTLAHAERQLDARLRDGGALVWDDDGPVSLTAVGPAVAGVPRIGPVYTPPEHRRRGYAAMAVAEASRRALAAGAPQVMLFTDLANPTSNKIYAEVGYQRFGDWEEYEFSGR